MGNAEAARVIGLHRTLALAAMVLGGAAAASEITGPEWTTAVALAERIKAGQPTQVFDLRSPEEFQRFHVPSAVPATLGDLLELPSPRSASIVLYGDSRARVTQAWALLRIRGYRHVVSVRQGLYEWIARVHQPALPVDATPAERAEFDRLAALSRFFGGQPRVDVPRAAVPAGYWTAGGHIGSRPSVETALLVAAIRRRGC
jgi:rhodanese-related sulfurtransferase